MCVQSKTCNSQAEPTVHTVTNTKSRYGKGVVRELQVQEKDSDFHIWYVNVNMNPLISLSFSLIIYVG